MGEVPVERHVRLGVAPVQAGDVLHVTAQVAPEREGCPVGERNEVVGAHGRDPVPEPPQIQFRDDALRQQGHHVRRGRDPVAVPHRFGDGRPTDDAPTLQDEDVASGLGQVRGARETVVPAPHHDHVTSSNAHGRGG